MSEPMWTSVHVKVPKGWGMDDDPLPLFLHGVADAVGPEYLEAEEQGNAAVWTLQGDSNYGIQGSSMEAGLKVLRDLRAPYVAVNDGRYEWSGSIQTYDGNPAGTVRDFDGDSEQGGTVTLDQVERLGSYEEVVNYLKMSNANVEDFSIDHLPAECPVGVE